MYRVRVYSYLAPFVMSFFVAMDGSGTAKLLASPE